MKQRGFYLADSCTCIYHYIRLSFFKGQSLPDQDEVIKADLAGQQEVLFPQFSTTCRAPYAYLGALLSSLYFYNICEIDQCFLFLSSHLSIHCRFWKITMSWLHWFYNLVLKCWIVILFPICIIMRHICSDEESVQ
jgi:hypothetical protein